MPTEIIIKQGDNLEILKTYPDNYFDSVVTDSPYGLGNEPDALKLLQDWISFGYHKIKGKGFMGNEWDSFVPQPLLWKEVFRVLKPGGYLLSFFGTRTYDWGTMAIRLAGFEIRDMITWHYGSGFPKSLDISKAIDKAGPMGQMPFSEFANHYKERVMASGLSHHKICEIGNFYGNVNHGGSSSNWATGKGIPTTEQWNILKPLLNLDAKWLETVKREEFERSIIGNKPGSKLAFSPGQNKDRSKVNLDISESQSQFGIKYNGWGTALKPATEPICVARKPIEKGLTVAENVLKYGTGGINLDGCRIDFQSDQDLKSATFGTGTNIIGGNYVGSKQTDGRKNIEANSLGRFPANVILDPFMASVLDEQTGVLKSGGAKSTYIAKENQSIALSGKNYERFMNEIQANEGGASRFFYCAKASQDERNAGCEHLLKQNGGFKNTSGRGIGSEYDQIQVANFHPTVKPISLIRYLQRLVTPKGGICLDPYAGSGTSGCAAAFEEISIVLLELMPEYIPIIEARTAYWQKQANRERYIQQLKESQTKLF